MSEKKERTASADEEQRLSPEAEIRNTTAVDHLSEIIRFRPLDGTKLTTIVDNVELENLITILNDVKEFALDLEFHSYHTYVPFACLMQISTQVEDFILDLISLENDIHKLQGVFENPSILKVIHGGSNDLWHLRKDCKLTIKGLFDTYIAAKELKFKEASLADVVLKYCDVKLRKGGGYDWTDRPLTEKMIHYARSDTHYLLYVYHCLKRGIFNKGADEGNKLMSIIIEKCNKMTEKDYTPPVFEENKWKVLCQNKQPQFTEKQEECTKQLYIWRNDFAKRLNESAECVLPIPKLVKIATQMPQAKTELLDLLSDSTKTLEGAVDDILNIVKVANEKLEEGTEISDKTEEPNLSLHQEVDTDEIQQYVHTEGLNQPDETSEAKQSENTESFIQSDEKKYKKRKLDNEETNSQQ